MTPTTTPLDTGRVLHAIGVNSVAAPRGSKVPRGRWKQWQTERQTPRYIEDAFGNGRGDDNIFAITGAVSKLVVLDCDDEAAVDYWRGRLGAVLDRTTTVRTGKGVHFWFTLPAGLAPRGRSSRGGDDSGKWDIKAEGGYVVAPPSIHPSGRQYTWERGPAALQPAPEALLEALVSRNGSLNGAQAAEGPEWEPLDVDRLFRGVAAGERDQTFYRFACSLRARDVPLDDAAAQVEEAWAVADQPPGDEFPLATALDQLERVYREKPAGRSAEYEAEADKKPTVATALVQLAEATHDFVQSEEGDSYAVPLEGPRIAQPLRGNQSFRRALAARYFAETAKAATSSALADALGVLEGRAYAASREQVHVRLAATGDGEVTLDLGGQEGDVVVVTAEGWEVVRKRGSLFRRTALTSAMPEPVRGGSLDAMRDLLNIGDESWDLLVGYMVAAWIPEIPHPVLWLTGEQGTGKTSALRMIASLLDPSPAQTRTPPRDIQEWVVTLSGSWVVPVDNVSRIPDWLSDAMCRAATGDGLARRQLYGDNDLVVNKLRNVVMLNGIGVGGLRGDLGDRLVPIELERIASAQRRPDAELREAWDGLRPALFGALLDQLSATLGALPGVQLASLPRMADFARVLAAVDAARGSESLAAYLGSREAISEQVVEGDSVAAAVRLLAREAAQGSFEGGEEWTGSATDLLAELERLMPREHRGKEWPTNAQVLSMRLTRVAPDLAKRGVQMYRSAAKGKARTWRVWIEGEGEA